MKKALLAVAQLAIAATIAPTAASAFDVSIDDVVCPMETIGEDVLNEWAMPIAEAKGKLSDAQLDVLSTAVSSCAKNFGWDEADTESSLEFNLSIIAATAISDSLAAIDIDAVSYESVLENRSAKELQQVLDDPENSPALKELTQKIISNFGDRLTDDITADISMYVAFMAQSQLSAMKMMGAAD